MAHGVISLWPPNAYAQSDVIASDIGAHAAVTLNHPLAPQKIAITISIEVMLTDIFNRVAGCLLPMELAFNLGKMMLKS